MPRPIPGEDFTPATQRTLAVLRRKFWWLKADIDAAIELGRCEAEASGDDLDKTVLDAARQFVRDEMTPGHGRGDYTEDHREDPGVNDRAQSWTADQQTARFALRPPRTRTPGQKRRFARDALIVFAASRGFSRPRLALIFGLARSRIQSIIATFRTTTAPDESAE